ncbi:ketopantoate reductase PanE/ApbA family protein, partial [Vibrio parahaemolyticus V-223/04]
VWGRTSEPQHSLTLDDSPTMEFPNQHIPSLQQADLILVTVKAWQVTTALKPLIEHIHRDAIVMLMHNGMGTAEQVEEMLSGNPVVIATTTHGAYKPNKELVMHTGQGITQVGGFNASG